MGKKRFYRKGLADKEGSCPIGLAACTMQSCEYYNLVVGCNFGEVKKRERIWEAAALVRLSDKPVYGKRE